MLPSGQMVAAGLRIDRRRHGGSTVSSSPGWQFELAQKGPTTRLSTSSSFYSRHQIHSRHVSQVSRVESGVASRPVGGSSERAAGHPGRTESQWDRAQIHRGRCQSTLAVPTEHWRRPLGQPRVPSGNPGVPPDRGARRPLPGDAPLDGASCAGCTRPGRTAQESAVGAAAACGSPWSARRACVASAPSARPGCRLAAMRGGSSDSLGGRASVGLP